MNKTQTPKILLTPRYDYTDPDNLTLFNYKEYYTMITLAGGQPILGKIYTKEEVPSLIHEFDGLLITGGADVNPHLYDSTVPFQADNDHFDANDLALYHAFHTAHKPIFGICRGIQIIGVAEGVKLIHDIPSLTHTEHNQKNLSLGRYDLDHMVKLESDTRIGSLFPQQYQVNSFHHQALAEVPAGFHLAAVSLQDHIIEAIEKENVLAVQWHPERLTNDPKHFSLAETFISDCLLGKAG